MKQISEKDLAKIIKNLDTALNKAMNVEDDIAFLENIKPEDIEALSVKLIELEVLIEDALDVAIDVESDAR